MTKLHTSNSGCEMLLKFIFYKRTYINIYYDKEYRNSSIEEGLHDSDVECLLFKYQYISYR